MKKLLTTLVMSLFCILPLCFGKGMTAHAAQASAEFNVTVTKMTPEDIDEANALNKDKVNGEDVVYFTDTNCFYLEVSISITNNPGFAGSAFQVYCDLSKYEVVRSALSSYKPMYIPLGAYKELLPAVGLKKDHDGRILVAIASMGSDDVSENGEFIRFYLKSKPGVTFNPNESAVLEFVTQHFITARSESITTAADPTVVCNKVHEIRARIGDVNNDGAVNLADSQYIINILNENGVNVIAVDSAQEDWFVDSNGNPLEGIIIEGEDGTYFMPCVADVNRDGVINMDDAEAILDYYVAHSLVNPDYTDDYIDTIQVYTVTDVPMSA